ncbi:MAG TPA: nucleoside 2-deoxyribosyltransferase [Azonexus sp.]
MKVYLAGPDVFRPDALAWAEAARAQLAAAGHQALVPLDNAESTAAGICRANLDLIGQADALLANLNPFRGLEPDSGTCFEIGYAVALGKRVIGYLADARPQRERLAAHYGGELAEPGGRPIDPQGMAIEDFALPVNLMLGVTCEIVAGDLARALGRLGA